MTTTARPRGRIWLRRLPLVVVAMTAFAGTLFLRDVLSLDALATNREALLGYRDAQPAATVCLFLVAYAAIVAFSIPGATVASLAGGFLFGVFPGVVWNVIGATVGACLLFLAVRAGLGERLAARLDAAEGQIGRIKAGLDRNQWSMLFLLRLLPVVPFFAANLIPALLDVPFRRFAVTTFLGIIPASLVYTSVGAGLGEVLARGGMPDPGVMFTPPVLLPILGLCLLAALPVAVKWWQGRQA
jgi:uncharacterized membrane protein YdjX (TVP38/TMEM64 family)